MDKEGVVVLPTLSPNESLAPSFSEVKKPHRRLHRAAEFIKGLFKHDNASDRELENPPFLFSEDALDDLGPKSKKKKEKKPKSVWDIFISRVNFWQKDPQSSNNILGSVLDKKEETKEGAVETFSADLSLQAGLEANETPKNSFGELFDSLFYRSPTATETTLVGNIRTKLAEAASSLDLLKNKNKSEDGSKSPEQDYAIFDLTVDSGAETVLVNKESTSQFKNPTSPEASRKRSRKKTGVLGAVAVLMPTADFFEIENTEEAKKQAESSNAAVTTNGEAINFMQPNLVRVQTEILNFDAEPLFLPLKEAEEIAAEPVVLFEREKSISQNRTDKEEVNEREKTEQKNDAKVGEQRKNGTIKMLGKIEKTKSSKPKRSKISTVQEQKHPREKELKQAVKAELKRNKVTTEAQSNAAKYGRQKIKPEKNNLQAEGKAIRTERMWPSRKDDGYLEKFSRPQTKKKESRSGISGSPESVDNSTQISATTLEKSRLETITKENYIQKQRKAYLALVNQATASAQRAQAALKSAKTKYWIKRGVKVTGASGIAYTLLRLVF